MSEAFRILGPRGQKLYPSPMDRPGKYPFIAPLQRDIKRSISQYDHAEKVTICAQIAARIPALSGAIAQKNEWAFPPDSWHPIFYGDFNDNDAWEDAATDWLTHDVFPNVLTGNSRKDLLRAICVSGMDTDRHGSDLALFSKDENNMPKMTIVSATRLGNGNAYTDKNPNGWWQTVTNDTYNLGANLSGYGVCVGGEFEGYRIYNGRIYDANDELIAVRVLGNKMDGDGKWIAAYSDFRIGFKHGAHLWSEYNWHGLGAPLPKMSTAILKWLRKEEIDDLSMTGLANAAGQTVLHQLAEGQDAPMALGDGMEMIEHMDGDGKKHTIYVSKIGDGSTKYIGSDEELKGMDYDFPTLNVQEFSKGNLVECLYDYGWPFSFLDSGGTGRAATRLDCELANNSIWQKQSPGEERMFWFLKYAIGLGLQYKKIPQPPSGFALDAVYRWTFGTPKEISVDAGNDVTAYLNMLRFGLTSQRIGASRWGYVKKRIDKDRRKEAFTLIDQAKATMDYAKKQGVELTDPAYQNASALFWMPNANVMQMTEKVAPPEANNEPPQDGIAPPSPEKPKLDKKK